MKELLVLILVLLLVSVALNVYQGMNAREAQLARLLENGRAQVEIAAKQAEIDTAAGRIQALQVKVAARKAKDSVSIAGLKQVNSRLALKIAAIRPLIAPDLAANDTLNAFVSLTDSLLVGKDSLIRSQEIFCQLQVNDLQAIIQLQNEKYVAQEAISQAWMETAAEAQKQVRKEKRKGKFKNVVIGVLGATVIYLSVKP